MVGGSFAVALLAVLCVALVAVWVTANARHLRRRRRSADEWGDAQGRPGLWTTAARCPSCGAAGGLLELDGDTPVYECLTCGRRQVRETRG